MSGSRANGARKGARWGMAKVAFRRNRERIQKDLEVELPLAEIHRQLKEALEGCSYDRFVRLVTAEFGRRNERKERRDQKSAKDHGASAPSAGASAGGAVQTATGGTGLVLLAERSGDSSPSAGGPTCPLPLRSMRTRTSTSNDCLSFPRRRDHPSFIESMKQ